MMPAIEPTEVGIAAAEAIRTVAARELGDSPIATYVETDPVPWSLLADGGWDTIGVATRDGGGGASLVDLVVTARAWGESCIPLPFVVSVMAKRWSAAARAASAPVTVSVARAQGVTDRSRAPFGSMPAVGVALSLGTEDAREDRLEGLAERSFDEFAPSLRLAEAGWATEMAGEARRELAIVWAAEATGSANRVLQLSVSYAKDREQFGRPIGSFQGVKHRLADMHMRAEAAETAVLWAGAEPDQGQAPSLYALDSAAQIIESAIQVHGGMGFTWEVGLHFYLRHVVMLRELVRGLWS